MNLELFMKKINFPSEAAETVNNILNAVSGREDFKDILSDIKLCVAADEILEKSNTFAKMYGFNEFEFAMTLIIAAADIMEQFFEEKGYCEERFYAAATDFSVKANECRDLYGYYGNFVLRWSVRVIRAEIQRFGRLEFEEIPFAFDSYEVNGVKIKKGDRVLSVHIPTDGPLLGKDVEESFKEAYDFYDAKHSGIMFVVCSSYLMYPPFKSLYKEGGNLRKFIELFDIIKVWETPAFESGWRIFGTRDLSNPEKLPKDTSLRREMAQYLEEKKPVGAGTGVFSYIPEEFKW